MSEVARAFTAVATGGFSELARKKPFQPGGSDSGNITKSLLGVYGTAGQLGAKAGKAALTPKLPGLTDPLKPAGTDAPAVQEAVAESARRRSRAHGYRSTILSQQFMSPDAAALKQTIGT